MRTRLLGLVVWALLIVVPTANAGIVYDNLGPGAASGGLSVFGNSGAVPTGGAADDIHLVTTTILTGFQFYTYEIGSGWDTTTLSTAIFGDASGKPDFSQLFYGANIPGNVLSKTATGHTQTLGAGLATEYLWHVALPDVLLPAGDYWFSLYLGYTSNLIYWQYAPVVMDNTAQVYVIGLGDWVATPVDAALLLEGTQIPSPGPLALIGLGMLGIIAGVRRKRG